MKVVFTQSAKSDLEQIGDYIAQDNPTRAVSFVRELRTAALALADTPRAFPVVPRYESRHIRRRPFGNYLIFYRVGTDQLIILRILHGARDYEPLLFPDAHSGPA
ncbi:MAG TPA: type II toxin-antitoxin system RelE/ParE family toxin [Rhodopila sp.]|nr:type II toxin-antitoxin system RelE/ParE family toxin [Rhodopila sp.]